jgi:hypothetical protein
LDELRPNCAKTHFDIPRKELRYYTGDI